MISLKIKNAKRLSLKEKLYQKSVVDRIKNPNYPYVVELDPTTACDLACPGCISGDLLNKNRFSDERLIELGKELVECGVKAVVLIGGGEPLNHPKIGSLIEFFGKNDVHIGLTTNGTKINKYLYQISEFVNWTRVSIDAATPKTYNYLRPSKSGKDNGTFYKVISNMEKLAKRKKGALGYSFLIRTPADGIDISNINEIFEAAKLAKDIGCDYFEVKPSYDMNHFLVIHDKKLMEKAKEEIQKAKELEDENFKVLESVNLGYTLKCQNISQPKTYTSCPVAELRTLITPSGVYVCPYFRGREDMKLGDLHNMSFKEMWNSERKNYVLKEYLNPSIHCKMHCIRHESNLEIFNIRKNFHNISCIEEFDRFI